MLMQNFAVTNKEYYGMLCIFCSGQYGHLMKLKEIKDLYALHH